MANICRLALTFGNLYQILKTANQGKNLGKMCVAYSNFSQFCFTDPTCPWPYTFTPKQSSLLKMIPPYNWLA